MTPLPSGCIEDLRPPTQTTLKTDSGALKRTLNSFLFDSLGEGRLCKIRFDRTKELLFELYPYVRCRG
jgi:hypothetical protein